MCKRSAQCLQTAFTRLFVIFCKTSEEAVAEVLGGGEGEAERGQWLSDGEEGSGLSGKLQAL